jgi:hypothetical protein
MISLLEYLVEYHNFLIHFIAEFTKKKDDALQKTRDSVREVESKMIKAEDEVYAWLSARGQNRTDLVKYLVNSNTDNMYSRISKDFYVERNKARKEGNVEFFTSNYEIYDLPKYKKWFADKITEQKKALELRYAYLKDMDLSKFNQAVLKGINSWVDDNDLSLDSAGLPAHPNAWLRENWWLRQTEASKEKNETTEYKFIKSHKPLFNYYNTIAELNKEFRDILELEYGRLPENFLPNIRADVLEKALTGNFKNVLTDMREMFQIRQDETMFGQMNNAGEYEKKVPIYFINPFVDEDGNIKRGEKSYDFGRSMILFAKMAYNNKYMREIEADVLALKEVMMKEAQFKKMNVFGKQTFDFMGNPATTAGADVKSMEMFNSFIDYYIYGIKIKEQGISKNIGGITINSTKALLEAKRYFSLKALGLGFIPAGASFVAATTQAYVEGSKGLIYTTKNWNDATRHMGADYKKYSALGYLFGVHSGEVTEYAKVTKDNNVFGIGDPLERDTIRKYVNARVLMRPFSYGDERIDNHIANAMALNYGIDDTGRIRRLINLPEGAKSLWERVQYKDDTLVIEGIEDPAIMRKAVIGFRNAVRAAQQKIKGSMSTEDINYAQTNLVLNLMMQFKTWMPGVLQERFGELRYNKYLDAPEWGRYRAYFTDFSPEKDKDIGAWLFNTVAKKAMQTAVDVATFGLVKTYKVDEVKSKLEFEKWRLENPDLGKGLDVKMYIEIKQKQINATIAELRILLIIAAVLSMLGADWDDDGINNYREFWITHKLYQILSRTATEIGFASPLNPSSGRELQRLVANPLPLAGLLSDVGKIAQNTYDEFLDLLFGEDVKMFGKTGKGDKTDNFYYTITLLPGGYQLRRFLDLYEQDQKALR